MRNFVVNPKQTYYVRKTDRKLLLEVYGGLGRKIISMMDDLPNTWVAFQYDGKFILVWNHDKVSDKAFEDYWRDANKEFNESVLLGLSEKELELQKLKEELKSLKAPRLTSEDVECVSDAYQEALEHKYYVSDLHDRIMTLEMELNKS